MIVALAAFGCGDNRTDAVQPDSSLAPDAVADAAPCVPATNTPVLASLTSGDLVISAAQQQNTVDMTVDLSHSILFFSLRENEASPQYGGVQCILRDADQVAPAGLRCRRNTAGTDTSGSTGDVTVHWTIATFASGVTVQRGSSNTGFTNPSTIMLPTAVDPKSSFVLLGGLAVGGGGWGSNEFTRAVLVDANTLDIRTAVAGSDVAWQVVTMAGASVQRGTTTIATGDTSATVPTMSDGNLALVSYNTDNASSIASASLMLEGALNGSSLTLKRGAGGTALDVSWEVVKLPFFARSFTTEFAPGETTKSQAIDGLLAASSVALASGQAALGQSGGRTDYAGASLDLLGEAAATLTTADGSVAIDRIPTASTSSISWTAINFAHDRCAAF
jgi:hypothetical protein